MFGLITYIIGVVLSMFFLSFFVGKDLMKQKPAVSALIFASSFAWPMYLVALVWNFIRK